MRWVLLGLMFAIGMAFLLLQAGPPPAEFQDLDSDPTLSTPPPLPATLEDLPSRIPSPGLPGSTQVEEDLLALIPREPSLLVLVVDKAGTPLPGAEVFWRVRSRGAAALHPAPVPPFLSPEEEAFSTGHELVADTEGSVLIPRLPWSVFVAGRHGDLIGRAEFSPDQESPVRLELGKARTIEILVVDEHGEPCFDVPVSILWGRSEGAGRQAIMDRRLIWDRPARVIALWKGRTRAPDGIAVARFLPDWIGEGPTDEDIVAAFQVPITGGQPALVDPKATGPVRLVLPPTGRVLVKLLDADGMPLACRAEVALCPTKGTDILGPDKEYPWYARSLTWNGIVVYPYVGLGDRVWALGALATDPRSKFEHTFTHFAGPKTPGEEIEVVLKTKEHPGPYKGRMVDEAGLPRAGVLVSVWVDEFSQYDQGANPSAILFRTGGDGGFGFQAKVSIEVIGLGFRFTEWQRTGPSGQPQGPWAYVIKERPFPPEGIDLGDIALLNDIPAVSGLVIDHSGKPVDKAFVRLCRAPGRVGPKGETGYFARSTWTDANGRFLIAVHDPGPFSLSASATGAKSDQLHFVSAGTHDVELRLNAVARKHQDQGKIELELLVDPGVPVDCLEVDCGNKEFGFHSMEEIGAEKEVHVLRSLKLKPGTYTVLVKACGSTIAEVDGLKVEPGVISKDPRLSPLDLRGRLRFGLLQVETSDRTYVKSLICAQEGPGTEVGVSTCRPSAAGTFKIPVPAGCTGIIVGAKGYKWVAVPVSSEIRKVVLQPGPRVRIRQVPADIITPYTPGLFGCNGLVLSWQRISTTSSKVEQAVVAGTGGDSGIRLEGEDLLLDLPSPGLYRFTVNAFLTGPDTKICAKPPLPRSSPGEIEIMDREDEQVIDLKIDPAEIFEARRRNYEGEPKPGPKRKP